MNARPVSPHAEAHPLLPLPPAACARLHVHVRTRAQLPAPRALPSPRRWCPPALSLGGRASHATATSASTPRSRTRAASTPTRTTWTVGGGDCCAREPHRFCGRLLRAQPLWPSMVAAGAAAQLGCPSLVRAAASVWRSATQASRGGMHALHMACTAQVHNGTS